MRPMSAAIARMSSSETVALLSRCASISRRRACLPKIWLSGLSYSTVGLSFQLANQPRVGLMDLSTGMFSPIHSALPSPGVGRRGSTPGARPGMIPVAQNPMLPILSA